MSKLNQHDEIANSHSFEYRQEDESDDGKALMAVAFMLEYLSDDGNQAPDPVAIAGRANTVRSIACRRSTTPAQSVPRRSIPH